MSRPQGHIFVELCSWWTWIRRSQRRSCSLKPPWLMVFLACMVGLQGHCEAIRCYVCGGHSGRPCEEIRDTSTRSVFGIKSPYVRPSPVPASDGSPQWEVCKDLINNRGCMKQVVNNVVLLRACWMQATDQCLVDGDATVCTCTSDLCNAAAGHHVSLWPRNFLLLVTSCVTSLMLIRTMMWTSR